MNLNGKFIAGTIASWIAIASIHYFQPFVDQSQKKTSDDDPCFSNPICRPKPSEAGLWGYIDPNGRTIIASRFNKAGQFSCGRSIVGPKNQCDGNHQQIIDKAGRVVNDRTFYCLGEFREGLAGCSRLNYSASEDFEKMAPHEAGVKLGNTYTFVDGDGNLLPFELKAFPSDFSHGKALVSFADKMVTLIHRDGSIIKNIENIYHNEGEWAYNRLPIKSADDPLNVKYGFIDENGNVVIPPTFAKARTFHDGLAAVELVSRTPTGQKEGWGFIDTKGVLKFRTKAASANDFSEGRLVFRNSSGYGFLDTSGHVVIQPNYQYAFSFHEGLASCRTKDDRSVYIDRQGKVQLEANYPYCSDFHEGLARIRTKEGLCGYINTQNKLVIRPEYTDGESFSEGLAAVKFVKRKWFFFFLNLPLGVG
ncbi:MAG: WG repeat-containing protein [Candidatus Obscuribacterales bacterium]|nr:WG repeat-containing protein [Candidatus Obscuribacterales bacterium]